MPNFSNQTSESGQPQRSFALWKLLQSVDLSDTATEATVERFFGESEAMKQDWGFVFKNFPNQKDQHFLMMQAAMRWELKNQGKTNLRLSDWVDRMQNLYPQSFSNSSKISLNGQIFAEKLNIALSGTTGETILELPDALTIAESRNLFGGFEAQKFLQQILKQCDPKDLKTQNAILARRKSDRTLRFIWEMAYRVRWVNADHALLDQFTPSLAKRCVLSLRTSFARP